MGPLVSWDFMSPTLTTNTLTDLVAIANGSSHSLAVNSRGRVFAWGSQATTPPEELTNAVAVAGGIIFDLALIADLPPATASQPL